MTDTLPQELIEQLRRCSPDAIAKDLNLVSAMDTEKFMKILLDNSKEKSKLEEEGFQPVSELGLLWIKKD